LVQSGSFPPWQIYLIILRIVPVMPFFMVNYLAGLTRIRGWTFAWTTLLGVLPGSIVYTSAGRQLASIETVDDIFSPPLLAAFAAVVVFVSIPIGYSYYRSWRR
jgi:uncharacterized membrane protein YdjX (TVP38/TMEM64 family)